MIQRVCIVSRPDLVPTVHGAAVKIMRTAEALSRLGLEVFIVTNDRLWFYQARQGIVRRRRYPQALLSLTNCPPALKALVLKSGLPTYWDALRKALDTVGYPRDEHFLYQALIDVDLWLRTLYVGWVHRIDVFQAEFPAYAVPAALVARLLGAQSSLVEHNVEYQRLGDTTELPSHLLSRFKAIEIRCARLVDHVICVSELDRAKLADAGVPREKLHVIPHGVDLRAYADLHPEGIRERYHIPTNRPLLVFHGTLHYWPNTMAVKHIAEDILPRLHDKGMKVHVMICGMNPPRYYAHPDITFTEVVQDLPDHLAAADCAIVPLDEGGGTRLKILEYFAAGLPVVSTSRGAEGIPLQPGVEIELADDMDAFADRILDLIRDKTRARALAHAGHAFVQAYDWDHMAARTLALYSSALQDDETDRGHPPRPKDEQAKAHRTAKKAEARLGGPKDILGARSEKDILGARSEKDILGARSEKDILGARSEKDILGARSEAMPCAQERKGEEERQTKRTDNWSYTEKTNGHNILARMGDKRADANAIELVSRHLPSSWSPGKSRTMIMMINRGCNLRCAFCDLYERPKRMSAADACAIIDDAAQIGVESLVLTGGEPFLHGELWKIIDHARKRRIGTNVTTNGTLIEKHLDRLLRSRPDSISVSLDGLEPTHDALRGIKGCHADTRRGLHLLKEHGIPTNIYFVITGENITELESVYDFSRENGFGFDFWPVNDAHHLYIKTKEQRESYRNVLDRLAQKDPTIRARRAYYEAGLDYHGGWNRRVRCLGLIEQFGINLEGDLVPCCVWDNTDLKVGNAIEEGLARLWTSRRAQARREQIFTKGCLNRCFNHSLYEFEESTGLSFVVGEGS